MTRWLSPGKMLSKCLRAQRRGCAGKTEIDHRGERSESYVSSMMSKNAVRRTIVVANELGLHLRPLAKFVGISERYPECDLKVVHDGVKVDGKSIVGMMMLAAGKGSKLELIASGDGAEQMLDELEALALSNFGE